jgi:hypothetical protein
MSVIRFENDDLLQIAVVLTIECVSVVTIRYERTREAGEPFEQRLGNAVHTDCGTQFYACRRELQRSKTLDRTEEVGTTVEPVAQLSLFVCVASLAKQRRVSQATRTLHCRHSFTRQITDFTASNLQSFNQ